MAKFLAIRMLDIRISRACRGAQWRCLGGYFFLVALDDIPRPYSQRPEKISAFNLSQSAMILRHSAMARAEWARSGCRFRSRSASTAD